MDNEHGHDDRHEPCTFTVSVPHSWIEALVDALASAAARPRHDPRIDEILSTVKRLVHMSSTVSQQLDDAAAREEVSMAKLSADLTAIAAELLAATPPVGSVITQSQADRHVAIATSLEGVAAAADALVTAPPPPPPPVHTAMDTTDATANGAARADGSLRNNFFLPGFDPTLPETT